MTVEDVIRRMKQGERLRWILNVEIDPACDDIHIRHLWIGDTCIEDDPSLCMNIISDPRVRELPGNDKNDQPYIDYELV